MSRPSIDPSDDSAGENPEVPPEVLEAIERLEDGETASKEDIEAALKF
jgi:hypothetical protein